MNGKTLFKSEREEAEERLKEDSGRKVQKRNGRRNEDRRNGDGVDKKVFLKLLVWMKF